MNRIINGALILTWVLGTGCAAPRVERQWHANPDSYAPGNHHTTITVDGRERTYRLHVPPAARRTEPLPLLIVLHGTYGTGHKMQLGLGFDGYANQQDFYVAYPDAYQAPGSRQTARWNDGRETLASSALGIDDVAFILAMLEDIGAKTTLDRSRVFVTGASNGGMMAYRLGCETAGVFAGVAPVIGNIPVPIAETCTPTAPLAFLAINGDRDPFIPFAGGTVCEQVRRGCEGGEVLSTEDSVSRFAAANGCSAVPAVETLPVMVQDGTTVERRTYPQCDRGAGVVSYVVRGGGHTWPPKKPQIPASGQPTGNLDATQTIVEFLMQ